jgi:glucose/arabinose dehydrogenase/mono/diheme cytochrome c family protein
MYFNKKAFSSLQLLLLLFILIGFSQCKEADKLPAGDPDNGGLALPDGFEAVVVSDSVGRARHLAVSDNGDIYVKLRVPNPKGIVALRDTDNDGKADSVVVFGDYPDEGNYGTAMRIYNDYLYFSTAGEVYRTKLKPGQLVPDGEVEVILTDDYKNAPLGYEHIAKPITFDNDGNMYVPFGSPGDVCQEVNRQPGSMGLNPCPELEAHGGIWQFDANKVGQVQADGKRYATGIRSIVGMDWNHVDNTLYALQHGRDNMSRFDPELFSPYESAIFPSEEFLRVKEGTDAGWPYYYYDFVQEKKLLNPEYGGDGIKAGKGAEYEQPIIGFPGHWAPNDLHFYEGDQFPERYKNGAFIAFHGSTIRAPYPQAGYFVAFVPFENGAPSGPWEVFADGFAGVDTIINTRDAVARPMGIAMGPDGSLYVTESVKGKIWRIMYKGDKDEFGEAQLASMEERKNTRPNIKHPDEVEDNLEKDVVAAGAQLYNLYCAACHLRDGKGDGARFPSLAGTDWVTGDKRKLIDVVLNGLEGPIVVNEQPFNGIMPPHSFLKDSDVASVLTYVRKSFGNDASTIYADEVARVRNNPPAR